jgi:tripartite-type tricarboxylate transporter receptor subunit TctC
MPGITRRHLGGLALGAALAGSSRHAAAQAWPSRPVNIVVPYPAGGSTDVLARAIGRSFSDTFGQPFVVDNRSGANGNIGANYVARAEPDGHTLMITTNGPITNNTLLYRSLPFNPMTDFAPIALLADLPIIIAARKQVPYGNVQELIAYAKANPGKINCGIPATGAAGHLAAELLQHQTGIRFTQIPYRGSAPLTNDLLGGSVDIAFDLVTTYLPHLQAGTIRALGITSAEKVPELPDVLPVQAQGVPDFKATGWISVVAPARTPPEVIQRLNVAANAYLAQDATKTLLASLGLSSLGGTPADLSRKMQDEVALWRPIVEAAGITME